MPPIASKLLKLFLLSYHNTFLFLIPWSSYLFPFTHLKLCLATMPHIFILLIKVVVHWIRTAGHLYPECTTLLTEIEANGVQLKPETYIIVYSFNEIWAYQWSSTKSALTIHWWCKFNSYICKVFIFCSMKAVLCTLIPPSSSRCLPPPLKPRRSPGRGHTATRPMSSPCSIKHRFRSLRLNLPTCSTLIFHSFEVGIADAIDNFK